MTFPLLVRPLLFGFVFVLVAPASVRAEPHRIGPGQEQRVLGLLAPYALGDEVAGDRVLWGVAIETEHIDVTLRSADGRDRAFALQHLDAGGRAAHRSRSFAIVPITIDADDPAFVRLSEAVRANDAGGFWEEAKRAAVRRGNQPRWRIADFVPIDGVVFFVSLFVLATLVAGRALVDAPPRSALVLASIVVGGALVRLALSPQVFLAAWPWSRLYPNVRAVVEGSTLRALAEATGAVFYVTDVVFASSFAYAILMPLVLFSHATYLMRDARAGLFAAGAIAVLPQHIRYARAEDGFVASLVLTSLAFALLHGLLRDRSRAVRIAYALALPLVLYPAYLLRPLNILFVVVYVVAVLGVHAESAPPARRAVALGLVLAAGVGAAIVFSRSNGERAGAIAADVVDWAFSIVRVVLDPRLLVLDDPTRTPPVLIALAFVGGRALHRRGERRLLVYLLAWLGLFVVAHAVVVVPAYQPRYHMHLVVPFLLLVSAAWPDVVASWRAPERRRLVVAGAASLLLAPWLHLGFIRDIDYAEVREYEAVRDMRALIPPRCTVVEVVHPTFVRESRMRRIAERIAADGYGLRFDVALVSTDGRALEDEPSLETLLADPPDCLFLYEGMACTVSAEPGREVAQACSALRDRLHAQTVLLRYGPNRFYDPENLAGNEVSVARVPFRLSRARPSTTSDVTRARPAP